MKKILVASTLALVLTGCVKSEEPKTKSVEEVVGTTEATTTSEKVTSKKETTVSSKDSKNENEKSGINGTWILDPRAQVKNQTKSIKISDKTVVLTGRFDDDQRQILSINDYAGNAQEITLSRNSKVMTGQTLKLYYIPKGEMIPTSLLRGKVDDTSIDRLIEINGVGATIEFIKK